MSGISTLSRRSFLIMTTAALAACKPDGDVLQFSGATMGTQYNVVAIAPDKSLNQSQVSAAITDALAQVNREMSNWDATSELSRLNASATDDDVALSPHLAEVLNAADAVHLASEGRFDVTVGPLIELWGFGAGNSAPHVPTDAQIADVMGRTGQSQVLSVGASSLRKRDAGAGIYLAAIGKGHGVDRVAGVLRGFGLSDFMVEIGGDLYTSGRNANGTPWQIGIESPVAGARDVHSVIDVSGQGMATSGDYRNFFEADGKRFSHIIDPTTGRPILHNTVSATVLSENAMLADAWATAMLVLGRARGLEIAEAQGVAVSFIDRNGPAGFVTAASSQFLAKQA